MKTLNVKERLELAVRGVSQLRALAARNQKMQYEEFAKAIGLMLSTDAWEVRHRDQVTAILSVIAAVERQGAGGRDKSVPPLDFDRIVNKGGKPGAGIAKNSRIVRGKP